MAVFVSFMLNFLSGKWYTGNSDVKHKTDTIKDHIKCVFKKKM